jgi:hypothetical protein
VTSDRALHGMLGAPSRATGQSTPGRVGARIGLDDVAVTPHHAPGRTDEVHESNSRPHSAPARPEGQARHPGTTIVIPAWDRYVGRPLQEAVASIRAQDAGVRVLIIDNASNTEPNPSGVEVVRSPRRLSLGAARNLGLEHVNTEFVMVWDADDVMIPGTLALLQQCLEESPHVVAFALSIVDDDTGRRHRWPRRWTIKLMKYPRLFALLNTVWSLYPTTGATLMRTADVRAVGGYTDADSGDDWGLGAVFLFQGGVGWDERPGRRYSKTGGSIWSRHSTPRHLCGHARAVRARLRTAPGAPPWLKGAMPAIAVAQWIAVWLVHVPVRGLRNAIR